MRGPDGPLTPARFSDESGQWVARIRRALSLVLDTLLASKWVSFAILVSLLLAAGIVALVTPSHRKEVGSGPSAFTIKSLKDHISFGDSYSSERTVNDTATPSGGRTWDRFVADYTGANLHNFAVSGAICSDVYWPSYSTRRSRQIQDQLPAWLSNPDSSNLDPETTVYSNWIGTNDLGVDGYLLGGNPVGTNITTFIECNWQVWDTVYANGGRYFVILNEAPLQYSPMYAAIGEGGIDETHYWPNKSSYDTREESRHMTEYTLLVNEAFASGLPYQLLVANRWPGATVVLYDVHSLLTDIYNNPSEYLESPANSTGCWQYCKTSDRNSCVDSAEPKASFLWFDELHPSERTDEVVAKGFVDAVVHGNSDYATYWSSRGKGGL